MLDRSTRPLGVIREEVEIYYCYCCYCLILIINNQVVATCEDDSDPSSSPPPMVQMVAKRTKREIFGKKVRQRWAGFGEGRIQGMF